MAAAIPWARDLHKSLGTVKTTLSPLFGLIGVAFQFSEQQTGKVGLQAILVSFLH